MVDDYHMISQRFVGKVAVVTGSGSGIGRSIAIRFAREGASTVVNDISLAAAQKVLEEIRPFNPSTKALQADVTKIDEVKSMVKKSLDAFGRIDILTNNVGLFTPKPFLEMDEKSWDRGININLKSTYLCCKAVIPHMMGRRFGKIVNVSSMAGKFGAPDVADYVAAKHAVIGLTKALAAEFVSYNISVNAVCPGVVRTPMHRKFDVELSRITGKSVDEIVKKRKSTIPMGRVAEPDEIAGVVAFLASEDASYITGQTINVFGGQQTL